MNAAYAAQVRDRLFGMASDLLGRLGPRERAREDLTGMLARQPQKGFID